MSKDEVLQKLYEIVRWDYAEGADEKYPCPFPANVGKHVKKLLREAEAHLTPRTLDVGYCVCPPSVPRYDAGDGWKCHWCHRPRK